MTGARATARSAPEDDERRATVATVARRPDGQANGKAGCYSEPNVLISASSASVSSRGTSPLACLAFCT